jgi:UDP-GlcNAc:undecaprenyl-phosphate/decaprenyl-phosphate GlcNAc-1-phosphate transferase
MRTASFAFLLSLVCAAALTPLLRSLAFERGWLDHGLEARKIHGQPIPRLGGVAIVLGFFAPLLGLLIYPTGMAEKFYADPPRAAALLSGGLVIALLGLFDDVRGAGAGLKLAVQVLVACGLWAVGVRVETLGLPGLGTLSVGILSLPLTVLWIAGVINSMNLIDGLDGLAGGVAFFALVASFVIAFVRGEATMALLSAALAGSVLGFLVYNFNPASIFMGDTGSMFLGYVLAAGSVQTQQKASTAVALVVPLVALGLPIADTLLAIGRRAAAGRPIFSADRDHIHHRLLALGLSQRQAVLVLYLASGILGACALVLSFANSWQTALTLVLLAAAGFFGLRLLYSVRRREEPARASEGVLPPRQAARGLALSLEGLTAIEELPPLLAPLLAALGARRLSLLLPGRAPLHAGEAPDPRGPPGLKLPLGDGPASGVLEAVIDGGHATLDLERQVALEVASDLVGAALARLGRKKG